MKKFKEKLRTLAATLAAAVAFSSAPTATVSAMPADAPAVAEAQAVSEQKADQKQATKSAKKATLTLSAKNSWHFREGQIITSDRVKKAVLINGGKTKKFECSQIGKIVKPNKNGQYKLTIKVGKLSKSVWVDTIRMSKISSAYSYYHPTEGDKFDEQAFRALSTVFGGYTKGSDKKISAYKVSAPAVVKANKKGYFRVTVSYGNFSKTVKVLVKEKPQEQPTDPTKPSKPEPEKPQIVEATVATQNELQEVLLNHPELRKLTISTNAAEHFVINGEYPQVELIVDAPKSEVYNFATWKSVTINAISANSFYEFASGNNFDVLAMSGRLVVTAKAVSTIGFNRESANFNLAVNGAANVSVNRKMTLTMSGTAKVPVVIGTAAEGSALTASVPVTLEMLAKANISLVKGAEGSVVYNRTSNVIYISTPTGSLYIIAGGTGNFVGGQDSGTTFPSYPSYPSNPTTPSGGQDSGTDKEKKALVEIFATEGGRVLVGNNDEAKSDAPFKANLLLNSKLPLKPEAYPGYVWDKWSDGVKEACRELTVKQAISLRAEFKKIEQPPVEPEDVTIALSVSGNGKIVDENNETVSGSVTFKDNEQKTVEAVSNNDETDVFVNWSDGETAARRVLKKDSPKELTAIFKAVDQPEPEMVTIEIEVGEGGKVYKVVNGEIAEEITSSVTFKENESVRVKAVSEDGYEVAPWSDGSTEVERVLTKDSPKKLTANFKKIIFVSFMYEGNVLSELKVGDAISIPTKELPGFTFSGWLFNEKQYSSEELISILQQLLEEGSTDLVVEAVYQVKEDETTITIDGEGYFITPATTDKQVTVTKGDYIRVEADKNKYNGWKIGDEIVSTSYYYAFYASNPITLTPCHLEDSEKGPVFVLTGATVDKATPGVTLSLDYNIPTSYKEKKWVLYYKKDAIGGTSSNWNIYFENVLSQNYVSGETVPITTTKGFSYQFRFDLILDGTVAKSVTSSVITFEDDTAKTFEELPQVTPEVVDHADNVTGSAVELNN